MISINNLQEQVLKNTKDIADIKELDIFINGLGIKVLGVQPNRSSFPEREYEIGDAWLVGITDPYDLWVFTRADIGEDWVNLGSLAIRGPQGVQGPKGDKGDKGDATQIYTNMGAPGSTDGYNKNDTWINTINGDVYVVRETILGKAWQFSGNIRGPQGLQGPQGIRGMQGEQGPIGPQGLRGDPGGFIKISGILDSASRLQQYPYRPVDINDLQVAYLVGPNPQAYSLYIQVGEDVLSAYWLNIGPLNLATYVSVNGVFQGIWDADTKLDIKTTSGSKVYAHTGADQIEVAYATAANVNTLAYRTTGGRLNVGDPIADANAATKKYVDEQIRSIPVGGDGAKLYAHVIQDNYGGVERVLSFEPIPYTQIWQGFSTAQCVYRDFKAIGIDKYYFHGKPTWDLCTILRDTDEERARKLYYFGGILDEDFENYGEVTDDYVYEM